VYVRQSTYTCIQHGSTATRPDFPCIQQARPNPHVHGRNSSLHVTYTLQPYRHCPAALHALTRTYSTNDHTQPLANRAHATYTSSIVLFLQPVPKIYIHAQLTGTHSTHICTAPHTRHVLFTTHSNRATLQTRYTVHSTSRDPGERSSSVNRDFWRESIPLFFSRDCEHLQIRASYPHGRAPPRHCCRDERQQFQYLNPRCIPLQTSDTPYYSSSHTACYTRKHTKASLSPKFWPHQLRAQHNTPNTIAG